METCLLFYKEPPILFVLVEMLNVSESYKVRSHT